MRPKTTILLIDDDRVHLHIYQLIVESAGFRGVPVLVSLRGMELPEGEPIDAVLLDYRLAPNISARSVALAVKARYPSAPILILSDVHDAPLDTAPIVQAFVRKGNPEQLLEALRVLTADRLEAV
jgi:DNA-binding NtrC family response regulator